MKKKTPTSSVRRAEFRPRTAPKPICPEYLRTCGEILDHVGSKADDQPDCAVAYARPGYGRVNFHIQQHLGLGRENQEDNAVVLHQRLPATGSIGEVNLALVADGCGGMAAGELASAIGRSDIPAPFLERSQNVLCTHPGHDLGDALGRLIAEGFERANQSIFRRVEEDKALQGMSSTAVCLALVGRLACVAWVGDSRCYLFRGGQLSQLTVDHSRIQVLLDRGIISPSDAETHPARHHLTNALGIIEDMEVEVIVGTACPGDCYLLTTDGFHEGLEGEEFETLCAQHLVPPMDEADLQRLAQALEERSLDGYGQDNLTLVMAHLAPQACTQFR